MTKTMTARDFNPSNSEAVDRIKAAADYLATEIIDVSPPGKLRDFAIMAVQDASLRAVKNCFYDFEGNKRDV